MSLAEYGIVMTPDHIKYFAELEAAGIHLTDGQKAWYIKKAETQGDFMTREFPSTIDEAFAAANEGFYFAKLITLARTERRICHIPPDAHAMKYASWDIGISDSTAIWTFQVVGKEVHFLDYYENSGEALEHYVRWIRALKYPIDKHFMPHDAGSREKATGKSYADVGREMGLKIEILEKTQNELLDIENMRNFLGRCWWDQTRTAKGIKAIENYRKEWNDRLGCYRERPLHNWASDGTKSFIYAMNGVDRITASGRGMSAQEWKKIRNQNI